MGELGKRRFTSGMVGILPSSEPKIPKKQRGRGSGEELRGSKKEGNLSHNDESYPPEGGKKRKKREKEKAERRTRTEDYCR